MRKKVLEEEFETRPLKKRQAGRPRKKMAG